ncbi:protein SIEVE ELEMENT OCCLUSION B [Hevea brasiliensis]|uniref:protein SIEVE ELEMENT OCCLUSION B n=1 Tax=Hevea brasiliensis TaxID=3981 RepID=UPI0025E7D696|nr:protein SIEVE ELEMENT OCCLUSION B [Hevea brasiliensis]
MTFIHLPNGVIMTPDQPSAPTPNYLHSDDDAIIKKVLETQKPDHRKVDVYHLFSIVAKILAHDEGSSADVPNGTYGFGMPEVAADIINKVSCEMACKCSGKDANRVTMVLLETVLPNYSWDAKLVITVASFAVIYGEFYLLTQFYNASNPNPNPVAKNIALLKQLQGIMEDASLLQHLFGAITELIKAIMTVTKCLLQLNDLSSEYFAIYKSPLSTATDIARSAYWAVFCVVTCARHFAALSGLRNQITIGTMTKELSVLASKVSSIQILLQNQLDTLIQEIEIYNSLIKLFNTVHQDNTAILQVMFPMDGGKPPLVIGNSYTEVKIDALQGKNVLLLISSLDCLDEIKALAKLYDQLEKNGKIQYKLVWVPVADQIYEQHFSSLKSLMPWYCVRHPSIIRPGVIRYFREFWNFTKQTILVPLYPNGQVQPIYTLDFVWASGILPVIGLHPDGNWKFLCEDHGLSLDLLIHDLYTVDLTMPSPIICLYGGEDIKWIEEFTTAINRIKDVTKLSMDLVYVSQSKAINQTNKAIFDFITGRKLGVCWNVEETYSWRFWARLESIFSSGLRKGIYPKVNNTMKDVGTLLSFSGSYSGWAAFGQLGTSHKMAKATGEVVLQVLSNISSWWDAAGGSEFFLLELNQQIQKQLIDKPNHCCHIVLPANVAEIADEMMTCTICDRKMGKYLMTYRCCE